jgi:hypothetical protein
VASPSLDRLVAFGSAKNRRPPTDSVRQLSLQEKALPVTLTVAMSEISAPVELSASQLGSALPMPRDQRASILSASRLPRCA